ncbi:hypothetical protein DFH11DRAFT_1510555 [Phellopilus nigrolimitatus]|nr:hypothetical protein DFH11DRAFT_1510555 [Phellopilus nigrolimitatus]
MFSTKLIAKGQEGGRLAAKQLSESVHFHLTAAQPCHLWTYIFFDKLAFLNSLVWGGEDCRDARDRLEEFMSGFNQSCERFVMADIGNDKEAAGAKIRASLDFHARSHETYKVVFGGCHNNGYVSQLSSLQLTSVYREKLVLLPGYTEMASEFDKLHLPSLVIPGLFIPDKIIVESDSKQNQAASQTGAAVEDSPANCGPPPGLPHPASSPCGDLNVGLPIGSLTPPPPPPYPQQAEPDNSDIVPIKPENSRIVIFSHSHSSTPDRHHRVILGHASGPVSYRPVSQAWSHNQLRSAAGPSGEWIGIANNTVKGVGKRRRISHDIPLSQHDPPPCTLFYLATNGCKHGPDCRFGHDYILDDEDFELMRLNARRVPCPSANRGETCVFGDDCCYGHTCPFENRCHFFKQGKCKFAGGTFMECAKKVVTYAYVS